MFAAFWESATTRDACQQPTDARCSNGAALRVVVAAVAMWGVACNDPSGPDGDSRQQRPILFSGLTRLPSGDAIRAIYSVRPDGSGLTRLSPGLNQDRAPEWSPDGTRVAYIVDTDTIPNRTAVHEVSASGTDIRVLATARQCLYPIDRISWSPDGRRLALGCYAAVVLYELGSGLAMSLRPSTEGVGHADWSPDGRRLVHHGSPSLAITNADGSGSSPYRSSGMHPAWSPDGNRIAYADGPTFRTSIYVANIDGSNVRRITTLPDTTHRDEFPTWSPDGTRLAFQRTDFTPLTKPPYSVIYVVSLDGRVLGRVSPDSLQATEPAW